MRMLEQRTPVQEVLFFLRWKLGAVLLSLPGHLAFVLRGFGGQCGPWSRMKLAFRSIRTHLSIDCPHAPLEMLRIIEEIVEIPSSIEGPIVECGCFLGGSTSKLSSAAAVAKRRLIVCDSFEGLPVPDQADHHEPAEDFEKGDFSAALAQVEKNVRKYGNLEVVQFVPGWFNQSLKNLQDQRLSCLYLDVDLKASIEDCLEALWWRMQPGTRVFVHDVDRPAVVEPFLDRQWWKEHITGELPKFVGSGTGLGPLRRMLGYAERR